MMLAVAIAEGAYDEIAMTVRTFQKATMAVKRRMPVVAAPHNLVMGGGCEVCLHADAINPHAETYMGLVEIGVGLLPAGGGTKEMAIRAIKLAEEYDTDATPFIFKNFMKIAMAKVSTSAAELAADGVHAPRRRHHHGHGQADHRRQAEGHRPGRQLPPGAAADRPEGAGPQHRRQHQDPALEHEDG